MGRTIACINMSLNGLMDHELLSPDQQIHDHYRMLLEESEVLLLGKKSYELSTYWNNPALQNSDDRAVRDFANAVDLIEKVVFSSSVKKLDWHTARISRRGLEEETKFLKKHSVGNILIGSPSLINQLSTAGLIDEYQILIHPIISSKGTPLFNKISDPINLRLMYNENFASGAQLNYYIPKKIKNKKA